MGLLPDALDRLDRLEIGESDVQDFYFLRTGQNPVWSVHYRSPGRGDWRVARNARLSVAIGLALDDMAAAPFSGQSHDRGSYVVEDDDYIGDMV